MPPLLNAQNITKAFGPRPLFRDLSFTIEESARIGLIGPNGAGKSTLLKILAGEVEPDSGELSIRKRTRTSYVSQISDFTAGQTVWSAMQDAVREAQVPAADWDRQIRETLGRAGFTDFSAEAVSLSGGWRKRLAIAQALASAPDVLLLDEPTNHLDLEGIEWLEGMLNSASFASVTISHDRYFLEAVALEIAEINPVYPDGILRTRGNYSRFLEDKEAFLEAQQRRQESLENRVRTEIEWLRRGPKARATKAKARIDKAYELIGELAAVSARNRTTTTDIEFTESGRGSKRLVTLDRLGYEIAGRTLFRDLTFPLTAGTRVGLVGPNGSGKTTLLRLLRGEVEPTSGAIERANALRIVYFDQNRQLDESLSLRRALAPDSDSVVYQDRVTHVASWASRFLFTGEQLNQPVANLSGGERARVLIAKLMLEPADLLLLDEPTNDLDIPTLEILEESLLEFRGALVLVTHDRYLLDRVSTVALGLDGNGGAGQFADYLQWEAWRDERRQQRDATERSAAGRNNATVPSDNAARSPRKKLSYLEAREYETIEGRIAEAEATLQRAQAAINDPAIASDAAQLQLALDELASAQAATDALYARWAELESKLG
ncbi:MAG TPA: ABC-F family ATP-binding cassette domain-containing protein [Acidobacteriaceae bacterium]|jgi:ATP-binding cassette subfamily F protein uup|nr:ABC-F family ATP-binding cassette domain-containing protein [Acidobacteriaceae bacterium]